MKKLSLLRWGARNTLGLFLIAVASFHPVPAQDVTRNDILQNKADEQDIRLHTAAVVTQVQGLIDELSANGISGDDIKVLQTTKAVLNNLSTKEMERVITSLQTAGQTAGTTTGQQNVVNAYAGQKGIILQFRQILKEYDQRQAAYELPERFKELADQQTETMRTTAKVAQTAAGKNQTDLSTTDQTTEQIVQSDQDSLANEVALAQQQLNKAAQGSTGDEGKAMQQAQQDLKGGQLQEALNQANEDLKAGQLLKALNEQKIARDELRSVTKDLNPPTNAVDALEANAAALAKLIGKQKNLLDQTNAAIGVKPPVTGLDAKQGDLVDEANLLQGDMQSMGATTADLVKDAIDPMQMSRAELGPRGTAFVKAVASQQEAIAKLEEAQGQLQQQLADAQKAAEDADKDPVAKLQDLQKQIQAAMQQQQQVTQQTDQAAHASPPDPTATAQAQQQQSQLQQQASNLQQTAQPLSLEASQALATATTQMAQAQQAMTNPANAATAAAAQQAAQAALAQANQQVGQQIAQDQQQAADPAALAAAATDLQTAQGDVSSAMTDATPATGTPTMTQAAAALAAAAQATAAAAATTGLPDAAATAVQAAQASITQGQQAATQGDASATAADAAAAQASLAQAQADVSVAQAGMTASGTPMAGGPPEAGPPAPDMPGTDGAQAVSGGSTDKGTLHGTAGTGKFVTVASRDRAALDLTQTENRPQEYASMIDQYMKNLADQSSASTP